jgi:hypothetical protein
VKGVWDRIWQGTTDIVTDRDTLHMVHKMKVDYTLPMLSTIEGELATVEVGGGSGRLSCFLAAQGHLTTRHDYSGSASHNRLVYRMERFLKRLDKSLVTEVFGLCYYVHAKNPCPMTAGRSDSRGKPRNAFSPIGRNDGS